jgi:hypothetical protein
VNHPKEVSKKLLDRDARFAIRFAQTSSNSASSWAESWTAPSLTSANGGIPAKQAMRGARMPASAPSE